MREALMRKMLCVVIFVVSASKRHVSGAYSGRFPSGDVTLPRHSSGGSGISLRERTGERKTQRNAKIPPTTAIEIASLRPKTSPSTPPAIAHTDILPHTIHLIVAFIRP